MSPDLGIISDLLQGVADNLLCTTESNTDTDIDWVVSAMSPRTGFRLAADCVVRLLHACFALTVVDLRLGGDLTEHHDHAGLGAGLWKSRKGRVRGTDSERTHGKRGGQRAVRLQRRANGGNAN